jgi:hypothetical protein
MEPFCFPFLSSSVEFSCSFQRQRSRTRRARFNRRQWTIFRQIEEVPRGKSRLFSDRAIFPRVFVLIAYSSAAPNFNKSLHSFVVMPALGAVTESKLNLEFHYSSVSENSSLGSSADNSNCNCGRSAAVVSICNGRSRIRLTSFFFDSGPWTGPRRPSRAPPGPCAGSRPGHRCSCSVPHLS